MTPEEKLPPLDDDAQRFIEATRADIRHGFSRACFVPSLDITVNSCKSMSNAQPYSAAFGRLSL